MNRSKEGLSGDWCSSGYLAPEDTPLPSEERLEEGPVAVVECPQKIPCDPCGVHCPADAIKIEDINEKPKIDIEKCTGCSICVQHCPGLAIFIVDCSPEDACKITLPYEFDLPETGEEVEGLNRKGEAVAIGTVKSVTAREDSIGDTPTVTIEIPEEYVNKVRNIRRKV